MSKIHDYISRVNILSKDPLIATLIFETDYSKSVVRVSYDSEIGKYWVQTENFCVPIESIGDVDQSILVSFIHDRIMRAFAHGLGSHGISIDSRNDDLIVYAENESEVMTHDDLRAFALHVIREFDTRYVPSFEEIEREVVAGLREIAVAAVTARVGEAA